MAPLNKTNVWKVQGYVDIAVEYNGEAKDLQLFVVQESAPPPSFGEELAQINPPWSGHHC